MMETFDHGQLEQMIASEGGPHLTIFLPPPTQPIKASDDAIRLSNLNRQARATLCDHWMTNSEADDFLKPLIDLTQETGFLAPRPHGVVIYRSDDIFEVYRTSEAIEERLFISKAFCIRPMLAGLDQFAPFFLLTLSKKKVALFNATPGSISQVENVDLPAGFEQEMADVTADYGAQTHTAVSGMTGKQGAVFHGQGGKADAEKTELTEYLRHVDDAVSSHLQNQNRILILAGVDFITAIYQQVSSYPRLAGKTVAGNVDHLSSNQLLQQSRPIAAEVLQQERADAAERIRQQRRDRIATDSEQILCAAYEGRIDTLVFDQSAKLCGSFYPDRRTLKELHHEPTGEPDDPSHDLIESAVIQVFRHRGNVHVATTGQMPVQSKMAAILRY